MTSSQVYYERAQLLKRLFRTGRKRGHPPVPTLDRLVKLMKQGSAEHGFLACLYFAGANADHPYLLRNKEIAIGISVLPEDAEKSGLCKRHPNQQEVVFVLRGSMLLQLHQRRRTVGKVLGKGDVVIIKKGQCHRILPYAPPSNEAVYLFAKTNPAAEPREDNCHCFTLGRKHRPISK